MVSKRWAAVFHEGVLDTMTECERMISEARQWIMGTQWIEDVGLDPATPEGWAFYEAQRVKVTEMEMSYYKGLSQLLRLGASTGILITRDSESGLLWREMHGLSGGFVYQANYHGKTRLPTGSWSVHT